MRQCSCRLCSSWRRGEGARSAGRGCLRILDKPPLSDCAGSRRSLLRRRRGGLNSACLWECTTSSCWLSSAACRATS